MRNRFRHILSSPMETWQRNLWVMFFAQICTAVGFSMIFPFLPLYVEDLGTNTDLSIEFWAGMVFSAQAITMAIASPFWGAIADRYGRKLMFERATFGGTVLLALMAFAANAEVLVLLRAIQGLITGTVAAANALVAASAPRERVGYAMGLLQVSLWAGVALGPLIGGVLADAFGFQMPFLITAAMLFVAGVLVHFFVHEEFTPKINTDSKRMGVFAEWRHILSMDGVMQTYVVRFLTGLSRSMIIPITPLYVAMLMQSLYQPVYPFSEELSRSLVGGTGVSTITGIVVGIASATATFSAVYLGRLGDRIGHRSVLIGSSIAAMLLYFPQALVSEPWQLIVLQAFTGLAIGGIVAAPSALLARYTEPGEEGSVYGMDNSVIAGARAAAPLVGAAIAVVFGLRATYLAMSGLFVVVIVVSLMLLPRDRVIPQASIEIEPQASAAD